MSVWYRNGTVSTTNGSSTVTGVTTYWATAANKPAVGDIFTGDDSKIYEIIEITDDNTIVLDRAFTTTSSGASYAIIRNTSATTNTRLAAQVSATLDKLGNKITVSTTAPSAAQGLDGDIWIVVTGGV